MGLLSAVAGMITMARMNSANPQAGTNFEMDAIGACFIEMCIRDRLKIQDCGAYRIGL